MDNRYPLPANTRESGERWNATNPTTPDMQRMMDAVAAAIAAGLFYNSDVYTAVIPAFDFTAEELARGPGVERGVVGMEIYYARKRLDEEAAARKEQEAFARLALQPGQNVGAVKMGYPARIKGLKNATVQSAEPGKIVLKGTAGGKHYTATMTAVSVARGMEARP